MNKVVISYKDQSGEEVKLEVGGNFQVGRHKTPQGPMIAFLMEDGQTHCLTTCPRTISRLQKGEGLECRSCHARLFWDGERVFIQDMGSMNGTTMNGKYLSGWEKKVRSDPVEIATSSDIKFGEFQLSIEPVIDRPQANPIIKQLGLDPVLGKAQGNGSSPIIINIQNLDAGTHKNIGSIDIVANRSKVDIDGDDNSEVDVIATRSDVSTQKKTTSSKKKKYEDIEFDEDK